MPRPSRASAPPSQAFTAIFFDERGGIHRVSIDLRARERAADGFRSDCAVKFAGPYVVGVHLETFAHAESYEG